MGVGEIQEERQARFVPSRGRFFLIAPELSLAATERALDDGRPMSQVTFSYTGQLANAAGASEEVVDLSVGSTVRAALDQLAARHDGKWTELVFDDAGRIRSTLLIVLDGVQAAGDKETISLDGVTSVMLMTPIAGG